MTESTVPEIDYNNPPFPLTAIDRELLAMRDEDFREITWEDLKDIIATNTLERLKRRPSDLRRYLAWSHDIKQRYGGITNYVVQERLHWEPDAARSRRGPVFEHMSTTPFANTRDYAILLNDWPYGFEPGIVHLLVWSKTPIAVDDERGDVTSESKKLIEDFIDGFFVQALGDGGKERVLWFKNWVSLQSVRGVNHVHVIVKDVPQDVIDRWLQRSPSA